MSPNKRHTQFAENKALQKWIGIDYTITDKEGGPLLLQSITLELNTGLDRLPQEMQQYFNLTLEQLQEQTLDQQKKNGVFVP